MGNIKYKFQKIKKSYLGVAGILLLLLLAVFLVWFNNSNSMQAMPSMIGSVYFDGEYRIGDGEWQQIVEGEHIPSTEGDVTLRGNFHMLDPEGWRPRLAPTVLLARVRWYRRGKASRQVRW